MPNRIAVSSADFIRNIGHWQNEALRHPISITHHGRERLILAAPVEFDARAAGSEDERAAWQQLRTDIGSLLENIDEGFIAFNANSRVIGSNAIADAFAGVSAQDMPGLSVYEVLPQPLASVTADRLQRVLRSRKAEQFSGATFDGRYVDARVFPTTNGVALLYRNTTDQQAMQRAVGEGKAGKMAIGQHANTASLTIDNRCRIEALDERLCAMLGFSPDEVTGHRFADLVTASQRKLATEMIEAVMRDGQAREATITLIGRKGQEESARFAFAPILEDFTVRGIYALVVAHSFAAARENAA